MPREVTTLIEAAMPGWDKFVHDIAAHRDPPRRAVGVGQLAATPPNLRFPPLCKNP